MPPQPPLDEIVHQKPEMITWWLQQSPANTPMDPNMIHRYIAESPFFDHMTNNGLAITQANTNMHIFNMTWNREAFEEDLRRKRGVEFMVVGVPEDVEKAEGEGGAEGKGGWAGTGKNGMYVVRKQERGVVRGRDGRAEESLTTLGTYYIVGENMYQAPSVGDVVSSRLVAATNHLSKFFAAASNLPTFDPTAGYTYATGTSSSAAAAKSSFSRSTSVAPTPSREASLLPGAGEESQRSSSLAPGTDPNATSDADAATTRLLAASLRQTLAFPDDHGDENPLTGGPKSFSFTHSTTAVKKRRAEEAAAALAASEAMARAKVKVERDGAAVEVGAGAAEKKVIAGSPPAVMTQSKEKERRGVEKRRREKRKSRAGNALTPGGPGAAVGGGGTA